MGTKPQLLLSTSVWKRASLGEVADFINGRAFKPDDWVEIGVPIVRIQNLNGGADFNLYAGDVEPRYAVAPGDLLFSWSGTRGTSFGPHIWNGPAGVLNQHIFNVRNLRTVEQQYLYYALELITDAIAKRAHGGTGIVHITKGQLEAFDIPTPPLPEQRKIAAILSSVDGAIEATQAVIDQLQVVKKAMMAELLTRGLPGRHTRFKQTEIGEVPEGWDVVPLGGIASVDRGKFSHRPRNDLRFYGGPYPFVQTGDVAASQGRLTRFSQTLNDEGLKVSRMFPAGTIIITIAANIGDTGIAMFPVAFPDSLVGILAGTRIDNRFLELVLRTRKKMLEDSAPQNAQKNINLETLRPLRIQVPPMSEQLQIASVFDALDDRVKAEAEFGQYLRLAKSALMSVLLTGELRVTSDEDAAA